jgi:hypothetical protein
MKVEQRYAVCWDCISEWALGSARVGSGQRVGVGWGCSPVSKVCVKRGVIVERHRSSLNHRLQDTMAQRAEVAKHVSHTRTARGRSQTEVRLVVTAAAYNLAKAIISGGKLIEGSGAALQPTVWHGVACSGGASAPGPGPAHGCQERQHSSARPAARWPPVSEGGSEGVSRRLLLTRTTHLRESVCMHTHTHKHTQPNTALLVTVDEQTHLLR